jgi:hypothetical protein
VRRLPLPLLVLPLVVAACGSAGSKTTTQTVTTTEPSGAETTPPKTQRQRSAPREQGQRIDVGDFYFFEMPSKRIGCALSTDPTTLRCDTAFPTRFSQSGHTCQEGDYGQAFELRESGPAEAICAGDTVLSSTDAHTIPYGKTWLVGPFACTSRTSGLTCRKGGHGLALSLQAQKLY